MGSSIYLMSISTSSGFFPSPRISATLSSDLAEEFEKLSSCFKGLVPSEVQGRSSRKRRTGAAPSQQRQSWGWGHTTGTTRSIEMGWVGLVWVALRFAGWGNHHDNIMPCLNQGNAAVRPNEPGATCDNHRHARPRVLVIDSALTAASNFRLCLPQARGAAKNESPHNQGGTCADNNCSISRWRGVQHA